MHAFHGVTFLNEEARESALRGNRAAHARAVESRDKDATARAARAVWAILATEPRYAWLLRPARGW